MGFWVYLLRCSDGSFYCGQTDEIERRLSQHQSGELKGYTSKRRPVTLAWTEQFPTRDEALAREHQIKSWSRNKKLALASSDWRRLSELARGRDR
jgi:tRNA/rRNA methyltransferase